MKGIFAQDQTYEEMKDLVREDSIVVLPIGGASKEHGRHLPCGTDYYIVDELAKRLVEVSEVIMLPVLSYGYYPAFICWPGSISIKSDTFIQITREILEPFIRLGVKKFLLLDIGVSTQPPLMILSSDLFNEYRVHVALTHFGEIWGEVKEKICEQPTGGHADEAETSLMLAIRPDLVHMERADEEYRKPFPGTIQNNRQVIGIRSQMETPHGIHGNPIPSTKEKGIEILKHSTNVVSRFIEEFRGRKWDGA